MDKFKVGKLYELKKDNYCYFPPINGNKGKWYTKGDCFLCVEQSAQGTETALLLAKDGAIIETYDITYWLDFNEIRL